MKKRYITVAAAAAIMLAFSGCGKVDPADTQSAADSAAPAVSAADNAGNADSQAGLSESDAELVLPADSLDPGTPGDPGTPDVGESSESGASEDGVSEGGDHVFNTPSGDYTYESLSYMGLANTMNGKQYCLGPSDGGAGHAYYKAYSSSDGGKTWNEAGTYDEPSGENYHFPLEDGRIILFNAMGPASPNVPAVFSIGVSDSGSVSSQQVTGFFDGLTQNDGTPLTSSEGLRFFITHTEGYNFTISFTDEAGNMVFNANYDLDPATLKIVQ